MVGDEGGVVCTRVSEPDVSGHRMDKEIVYRVEVVAEVIVEDRGTLVCCWIQCPKPSPLLHTANTVIASRCTPIYQSLVVCASIRSVDWRIRQVLRE